jgi:hypothetical protein
MADYTSIQALEPLSHIVSDVRRWDQGLDCTIDLFYREVEKRAMTRGWRQILLLDLPALGAVYDNALSRGSLDLSRIPAAFGKLSIANFDDSWIFRSLLQHTFDGFGTLDATTPVEVIAATRQLLLLYKKAKLECPKEKVYDAVEDYVHIEKCMRTPSGTWDHDVWLPAVFSFDESFCGDLSAFGLHRNFWRILDLVFGRLVPGVQLLPEGVVPKHGPGAVSDVRTGSDKYCFPYWPTKLGGLFPSPQFACANEYLFYADFASVDIPEQEPPAKLLAVPKTYKGPRLIASEPTAHQFLQQGLMQWIRQNMPEALRACVDFSDQSPSRMIALEASRSGDLATVDLSSASDRLSCWVVERAFKSNQSLLQALHATRTRHVVDATGTHEGLGMRLKKFAAQGSAVTFPVQTIVYAGVAIAALLYDNLPRRKSLHAGMVQVTSDDVLRSARNVRVFGDDIVLPSSNVPTLVAGLQALGLKVNASKTHYTGLFRESCGMDAYSGHDVTPVYIGDLLLQPTAEGLSSWIEVSNSMHLKACWQTASWMLTKIDKKILKGIVYSHETGSGIRATTFCKGTRFHGPVRIHSDRHTIYGPVLPNQGLQVQERKVICISTKEKRVARGSWQDLYQYYVEAPSPETYWSAGVVPVKKPGAVSSRWVPV